MRIMITWTQSSAATMPQQRETKRTITAVLDGLVLMLSLVPVELGEGLEVDEAIAEENEEDDDGEVVEMAEMVDAEDVMALAA